MIDRLRWRHSLWSKVSEQEFVERVIGWVEPVYRVGWTIGASVYGDEAIVHGNLCIFVTVQSSGFGD